MNDTESRSIWFIIGGISALVLWLAVLALLVFFAVNGTGVTGKYVSEAGTLELMSSGSAVWSSDGSTVEGRFIINTERIDLKPDKGKRTAFRRVGNDLRKGNDLYVRQLDE